MKTVSQVVIEHLHAIGADGLCSPDCGCPIDALFPCEQPCGACIPARFVECEKCQIPEDDRPDACDQFGGGCFQPKEET